MPAPFSPEQYFQVFADYNLALWPAQVAAHVLALLALALTWRGQPWGGRAVALILGAFFAQTGLGYHLRFFSAINPVAPAFGMLFLAQGLMLMGWALWRRGPLFAWRPGGQGVIALIIIAYALVFHPLLATYLGHGWPRLALVGLTPCPTSLFFFGMVLLCARPAPLILFLIPLAWSIIASYAAYNLGVAEDAGLVAAGFVSAALSLPRPRQDRQT